MLWSRAFIPTLKDTPQEAESLSHKLMLRSGLVRMLMSGVYSYLPCGLRVLNNIQKVIRQEMNACGAAELLLPALQPKELWVKSGREKDMAEIMIRFVDRRGRNICLGPTHEEVITDLVKNHVSSYRQLPLLLYQIQTKFRDEIRPRFGLVRSCEFVMKDAYSFDQDEEGLEKNYGLMLDAYKRIFKRLGLDCLIVEADPGVMGGSTSHEFMVSAESGEDSVLLCPECHSAYPFKEEVKTVCRKCQSKTEKINTIEVGHIFKLGTKYSVTLGANFTDVKGIEKPIIMGCYGIGVSRLISAVIEQNHDADGIIWPHEISPYKAIVLPLDMQEPDIRKKSFDIYDKLTGMGIETLIDDRDERPGVKFKDADLLGVSLQIIIGKEFSRSGNVEIKIRRTQEKAILAPEEAVKKIKDF